MQLKRPVHFVCPEPRIWPELRGAFAPLDAAAKARLCIQSWDIWILRTCYELRLAGEAVTLSDRAEPGRINVADIYNFGRRQRGVAPFVVVARADGHEPQLANCVLRQNETGNPGGGEIPIPHWAQPSVIPRDPARGARISAMEFKGAPVNLDPAFSDPDFLAALGALGVAFHGTSPEAYASGRTAWNDYAACDLALAVRNITEYDARGKPASKLVNAWWGETPALLGPETAYRELRRGPLDYIEVRTPREILAAIRRLQDDPGLYRAMIENGRRRREEFSDQAILGRWIDALNGPLAEAFDAWEAKGWLARLAHIPGMMLREPLAKRRHRRGFSTGRRILDDAGGSAGRRDAAEGAADG